MTLVTGIPFLTVGPGIDRKILAVMIPGGLIPRNGVMAIFTGRRKSGSLMVRVVRSVVFCFVAGKTIGGCIGITILMTAVTGNAQMRSGKRESGIIVIEIRRRPGSGTVADRAIMSKIIGNMIRILHSRKIRFMTGIAIHGCPRIARFMTVDAIGGKMRTGQRE